MAIFDGVVLSKIEAPFDPMGQSKEACYQRGIELTKKFLRANGLPIPTFHRYTDTMQTKHAMMLRRFLRHKIIQGTGTGFYQDDTVFVNIPVLANPVKRPQFSSWSYPCYKIDRTGVGVVAHEVGHHVESLLTRGPRPFRRPTNINKTMANEWRYIVREGEKQVSSYEPRPSEAWAETLRLFILNPNLLELAIPLRYAFLVGTVGLQPSERRNYRDVLIHPAYIAAAERWISKKR